MAGLIRGKQAGVQKDLSAGLVPDLFALDIVSRYGVNSQAGALAYDPVQSLLAVGTKDSKFGSGKVYIYGQNRVSCVFEPPRPASIIAMQFCSDKLLVLDSRNDLSVFDLDSRKIVTSYAPPGRVTCLCTDPTFDYALIGLANGELMAYDIDREGPAPFRIASLWKTFEPRARPSPVISMALHPRDVGTLLVGYPEGVAIYSFKQAKAIGFLVHKLEPGAPGGSEDPSMANGQRFPKLVHATWHPTGTFILTAHDDESLVVWDSRTYKVIQARTLQHANVHLPGSITKTSGTAPGTFAMKAPIFKLAWCAKQNPDDTGILVAGGLPMNLPERGLTFLDLGQTPLYATSSWQVLSEHFEKPKKQHILSTPPGVDVVDFCLIPKISPHFAGAQDPIAVIAILGSGELVTMHFPSGYPIPCTNQLHPSLSFIHPFVDSIAVASLDRTRWLGMIERRTQGPPLLKGGASGKYPSRRFEGRNIIQTAHADGTVRLWDTGHGDEIENPAMIQVDVARSLGRVDGVGIARTALSGVSGELAVGMRTGEVLIFRYDKNKKAGQNMQHRQNENLGMEDIRDTADPSLKEGLLPLTMFTKVKAPVTALRISDVGFAAAGFEDGSLVVIDLRGPAVIYQGKVTDLSKGVKRSSLMRRPSSASNQSRHDFPTVVNFGVMNLEDECKSWADNAQHHTNTSIAYSSIQLFAGSFLGHLITLKVLPDRSGAYRAEPAGATHMEGRLLSLTPLDAGRGLPANATAEAVTGLQQGRQVDGIVLAVSTQGIRLFRPPHAKGASKSFDGADCQSAGIVRDAESGGIGLVGLFGDGTVKSFALPSLREIASQSLNRVADRSRFSDAVVTAAGGVYLWSGPSEILVVNPWGAGQDTTVSLDLLYNPQALLPPRPTISNVQWLSGTQHVTPADLDLLIGGPNRPPSKRMIAQMKAEEQQRREGERAGPSSAAPPGKQDEGYLAYMQRQVTQRTQNMNIVGDNMNRLEESSSQFADDVGKFVSSQKKKAVMSLIGSKFGL